LRRDLEYKALHKPKTSSLKNKHRGTKTDIRRKTRREQKP
jgi:hypothetical protein